MGFEVFKSDKNGKYYYRLKASNGEIILQSERGYTSKADAKKGINMASDNIRQRKIESKVAKNGKEYFVVKADNGNRIAGKSQMYRSKAGMNKGIESLISNVEALVVKEDDPPFEKSEKVPENATTKQMKVEDAIKLIDELSEKDQYFIRWWMMKHKTKEEVAEEWNIKPASVIKLVQRALKKMKAQYDKARYDKEKFVMTDVKSPYSKFESEKEVFNDSLLSMSADEIERLLGLPLVI